jgi:hypothetical protein
MIDTNMKLNQLTLYYHNVHGLSQQKLSHITNLISCHHNTIFIIAEHWFPVNLNIQQHPYTIRLSNPAPSQRKFGHQNGGLALLCHTSLHPHISKLTTSQYHISFSIYSTHIQAVYLPPSLDLQTIESILDPTIDLLLGDVNAMPAAPSPRSTLLSQFTSRNQLQYVPPSTGSSKLDHIFSRKPIEWHYSRLDREVFNSDHGRMMAFLPTTPLPRVSIITPGLRCKNENTRTLRYNHKVLSDHVLRNSLIIDWEVKHSPRISHLISSARVYLHTRSNCISSERQELIDSVYETYMESLKELLNEYLPIYDPGLIRNTIPDLTLDRFSQNLSNLSSTRLFKRSLRSNKDHINLILEDTIHHFETLYATTSPIDPVALPNPPCDINGPDYSCFNVDKIKDSIKKYPSSRAPGPDSISPAILKALVGSPCFLDAIEQLFRLFYQSGHTPNNWNITTMLLLPKIPNVQVASETRPISLTQTHRRIFERLLLDSWKDQGWTVLHPSQAGFRHGFSCISQILRFEELTANGYNFSCFLDFKAAYDTVETRLLIQKLIRRQCPPRSLYLINSLMTNTSSRIIVNNSLSQETIVRSRGLLQGSIISPLCFNLFLDDLIQACEHAVTSTLPVTLAFADDVAIKTKSHQDMQTILNVCSQWSDQNRLSFNLAKCGYIHPGTPTPLLLCGQSLPLVNQYKYLGIVTDGIRTKWTESFQASCLKATNTIKSLYFSSQSWHPKIKLNIIKTYILSQITYSATLAFIQASRQGPSSIKAVYKEYSSLLSHCIKWLSGSSRQMAAQLCLYGLDTAKFYFEKLLCSLFTHINNLSISNPLLLFQNTRFSRQTNFKSACMLPSLLDSYQNSPPVPAVTWKTYLKRARIQSYAIEPGILQHFMSPAAKGSRAVDNCLNQTKDIAELAIKIRLNMYPLNSTCPTCMTRFTRSHIDNCRLCAEVLPQDIQDEHLVVKRQMQDRIQHLYNKPSHYTVLDSLLNMQNYSSFKVAARHLFSLWAGDSS